MTNLKWKFRLASHICSSKSPLVELYGNYPTGTQLVLVISKLKTLLLKRVKLYEIVIMFWKITMVKWGKNVCMITKWSWISLGQKTYLRVSISFLWPPWPSNTLLKMNMEPKKSPKWKRNIIYLQEKTSIHFWVQHVSFPGCNFARNPWKCQGNDPAKLGLLAFFGMLVLLWTCPRAGGFVSRKKWGRNDFIRYKTSTKVCLCQLRKYQSTNNWGIKKNCL